jgi:hypothetical protein
MIKMDSSRAINGTWGEVFIDGEKMGEVFGLSAMVQILKEDVPIVGVANGKGKKIVGYEMTGSLRFMKVSSKLMKKQSEAFKAGKQLKMTINSSIADPDSFGSEKVALYGVTFDEITLAGFEAQQLIREEKAFSFENYELLETITEK